ncbi:Cell cycle regulator Mat89Bb [Aphelenchoides bicaudatus]|nr:Cell cycle regulator Mat89Bb [Aphelenchoides bicaudatus]
MLNSILVSIMLFKNETIGSASHKTVIVIDRSKKFCQRAQEHVKYFDPASDENVHYLSKWSVAIQCVIEFQRVLSDIYPYGSKQVRLCISDTAAKFITPTWKENLITYNEVINAFLENQPDLNASSAPASILNGLNLIMDALVLPSVQQAKFLKMNAEACQLPEKFDGIQMPSISSKNASENRARFYKRLEKIRPTVQKNVLNAHRLSGIENSGTVIVFTSVNNLEELNEIVTFVEDQISERNELYKSAAQIDLSMLPISQIRLLIVHISEFGEPAPSDSFILDCQLYCMTKNKLVRPTVYFTAGTSSGIKVIHEILCSDYAISSTTVTNIPMKEESDPKKSQNYNVEIFHANNVHNFFKRHNLLELDSPIANRSETEYTTAMLKWSGVNNRLNLAEPPLFYSSSLVTLSSVRSRPSNCFSIFLLGGKTVMLDVNINPLPSVVNVNFFNTTISHFCTADLNNGALSMKCMSFKLAGSYKLLQKHKFGDSEINSYKNLLELRQIQPTPIKECFN